MGRGKGRRRHIHGVPEEGPVSQADQEPLSIGKPIFTVLENLSSLISQLLEKSVCYLVEDKRSQ